jgi:hypothetical protein
MHRLSWLATTLALLTTIGAPTASSAHDEKKDEKLRALDGEWLFVEDRTEGRAGEDGGAPISKRFTLRVEKDAVIYPRRRGDERITLDGSVIEKTEDTGSIAHYHGKWSEKDSWLEYWIERKRSADDEPYYVLKRVFRITDEGLLVYVFSNKYRKRVALYRHPEDIGAPLSAQDEKLCALDGEWLFVEDRTEGRAAEEGGAPMNMRFTLRVEKDAVIYPRRRGDERITLDNSVIEKEGGKDKEGNNYVKRYRGKWTKKDGWLEYWVETVRVKDNEVVNVTKRVFRITDDGLLVDVSFSDTSKKQVALYRHPEDIELPEPAKATINDMAWLADAWTGMRRTSSIEERWSPPKGGAMLGVSRTVMGEKMVGFEYLRIVERDGGLVYVAQPGGRPSTEYVLTELKNQRAIFVNPRHDYPQRIVYELSKEGVLTASIGFAKGRIQSFEYKREAE